MTFSAKGKIILAIRRHQCFFTLSKPRHLPDIRQHCEHPVSIFSLMLSPLFQNSIWPLGADWLIASDPTALIGLMAFQPKKTLFHVTIPDESVISVEWEDKNNWTSATLFLGSKNSQKLKGCHVKIRMTYFVFHLEEHGGILN